MNINDIKKVCVVGAGNMGHQISLLAAISGYKVSCTDISKEQLQKAEQFSIKYIQGRVKKGKLNEEDAKKALILVLLMICKRRQKTQTLL